MRFGSHIVLWICYSIFKGIGLAHRRQLRDSLEASLQQRAVKDHRLRFPEPIQTSSVACFYLTMWQRPNFKLAFLKTQTAGSGMAMSKPRLPKIRRSYPVHCVLTVSEMR